MSNLFLTPFRGVPMADAEGLDRIGEGDVGEASVRRVFRARSDRHGSSGDYPSACAEMLEKSTGTPTRSVLARRRRPSSSSFAEATVRSLTHISYFGHRRRQTRSTLYACRKLRVTASTRAFRPLRLYSTAYAYTRLHDHDYMWVFVHGGGRAPIAP